MRLVRNQLFQNKYQIQKKNIISFILLFNSHKQFVWLHLIELQLLIFTLISLKNEAYCNSIDSKSNHVFGSLVIFYRNKQYSIIKEYIIIYCFFFYLFIFIITEKNTLLETLIKKKTKLKLKNSKINSKY